jgi:hypothetical protein
MKEAGNGPQETGDSFDVWSDDGRIMASASRTKVTLGTTTPFVLFVDCSKDVRRGLTLEFGFPSSRKKESHSIPQGFGDHGFSTRFLPSEREFPGP